MSTGIEKTDRFIEYINKIAVAKPATVTDQDDALVANIFYDLAPALLAIQVLEKGVSEFSKQQFILGMLWERYKNSENDEGLNDLLKDVKI